MEPEAVPSSDEHLSASVSTRRRSQSFSDDYSVQRTNDDATQCKVAAVQLRYWADDFLKRFAGPTGGEFVRRDPEISIGYWARVAAVNQYVQAFIEATDGKGQIISLGCGFDTLYWRLKSSGKKFVKLAEVDFSSVTAKKIRHIRKPGEPDLVKFFSEELKEEQHCDLHAGDYHLIGADLRQWNELKAKLDTCAIDYSLPVLVLAECVLVYMSLDQSSTLLKKFVETFDSTFFVNYEQLRTSDAFGKIMEKNLEQRGLALPGLIACQSVESQKERFLDAGFSHVNVLDMNKVYRSVLAPEDVKRVENIEHLDEMELLHQLLDHYCIVTAASGQKLDSLAQMISM